ncbi:hypothetical protein HZH68_003880 [Vespula germanica]|uniref:Uncharacterized protein n=1 Tax=Vespula germanica TaxID=30212 RepID=A0A836UWN3_VESGE|nr:hypothetical protein HZH68_003880 [Vespula germanica]
MKPNVEITLLNEEIVEEEEEKQEEEEIARSSSSSKRRRRRRSRRRRSRRRRRRRRRKSTKAVPMMRTAILKTTSIGNVAAPRVEVTGVLYNLGRGSTEGNRERRRGREVMVETP